MKDWNGMTFTFDISDPSQPVRTFRVRKPCHLIFEIESWKGLKEAMKEANNQLSFETPTFVVGEETWSMVIYPEGNKPRGGTDYVSMYLKRHQSNVVRRKAINVTTKFFVMHQPTGQYLVIEDLGEKHYDTRGTEWGIPNAIKISDLQNGQNGLLIDEKQVTFGAEVFVTSDEPSYSKLTTVKLISRRTFNLVKLGPLSNSSEPMESQTFNTLLDKKLYKWKLQLYRQGYGSINDNSWSLFLVLDNTDMVSSGKKMLVSYELSLLSKANGTYTTPEKEMAWISSSNDSVGFPDFIDGAEIFTSPNNYAGGGSLEVKVQFNSIFLLGEYDP